MDHSLTMIVTILVIYGVHAVTSGGMLLDNRNLYGWITKRVGRPVLIDKIFKALFDCTPCMSSVYGSISFFIYVIHSESIYYWPIWVLSIAGFNYILNRTFNNGK